VKGLLGIAKKFMHFLARTTLIEIAVYELPFLITRQQSG
jgi:hypothetical protein